MAQDKDLGSPKRLGLDLALSLYGAILAFAGSIGGTAVYAVVIWVARGRDSIGVFGDLFLMAWFALVTWFVGIWFSVPLSAVAGAFLGSITSTKIIGSHPSAIKWIATFTALAIAVPEATMAVGETRCMSAGANCSPGISGVILGALQMDGWKIAVAAVMAGGIGWWIGRELLRSRRASS